MYGSYQSSTSQYQAVSGGYQQPQYQQALSTDVTTSQTYLPTTLYQPSAQQPPPSLQSTQQAPPQQQVDHHQQQQQSSEFYSHITPQVAVGGTPPVLAPHQHPLAVPQMLVSQGVLMAKPPPGVLASQPVTALSHPVVMASVPVASVAPVTVSPHLTQPGASVVAQHPALVVQQPSLSGQPLLFPQQHAPIASQPAMVPSQPVILPSQPQSLISQTGLAQSATNPAQIVVVSQQMAVPQQGTIPTSLPVASSQPYVASESIPTTMPVGGSSAMASQPIVVPQPLLQSQPVIASQPVVGTHPLVATQPINAAQPLVATQPVAASQPIASSQAIDASQPLISQAVMPTYSVVSTVSTGISKMAVSTGEVPLVSESVSGVTQPVLKASQSSAPNIVVPGAAQLTMGPQPSSLTSVGDAILTATSSSLTTSIPSIGVIHATPIPAVVTAPQAASLGIMSSQVATVLTQAGTAMSQAGDLQYQPEAVAAQPAVLQSQPSLVPSLPGVVPSVTPPVPCATPASVVGDLNQVLFHSSIPPPLGPGPSHFCNMHPTPSLANHVESQFAPQLMQPLSQSKLSCQSPAQVCTPQSTAPDHCRAPPVFFPPNFNAAVMNGLSSYMSGVITPKCQNNMSQPLKQVSGRATDSVSQSAIHNFVQLTSYGFRGLQ